MSSRGYSVYEYVKGWKGRETWRPLLQTEHPDIVLAYLKQQDVQYLDKLHVHESNVRVADGKWDFEQGPRNPAGKWLARQVGLATARSSGQEYDQSVERYEESVRVMNTAKSKIIAICRAVRYEGDYESTPEYKEWQRLQDIAEENFRTIPNDEDRPADATRTRPWPFWTF